MSKSLNSTSFYFFIAILLFIIAFKIKNENLQPPAISISREDHSINFNSYLLYLNGGLKRFSTAALWVKTLLDSDLDRNYSRKNNSWMFHRFYSISQLDPLFLENYQFGGQYLSIVKDDLKGAQIIFSKGINYYKNDFILNYNIAFLYFNELKLPQKALPHLLQIRNDPSAPKFINSLIATLMQKSNIPIDEIIYFTKEAQKQNTNPLYSDLYQIKLKQLNELKEKGKHDQ